MNATPRPLILADQVHDTSRKEMSLDSSEPADTSQSLWRVRHALRGLQEAFATDRFAMEVLSLNDDMLRIEIHALEGACAECLIPEVTIRDLIRTQIPSDLGNVTIDVHLDVPADWTIDRGHSAAGTHS